LANHINLILASSEPARFAVGHLFLSGLAPVAEKLARVKELRLLIGNTINRETLEQLAEGYQRLEMVADAVEAQAFPSLVIPPVLPPRPHPYRLLRVLSMRPLAWQWFSLKWHGHLGHEFARAEPALSGGKGCSCHLKLKQYR
jgi:hypothetical protein